MEHFRPVQQLQTYSMLFIWDCDYFWLVSCSFLLSVSLYLSFFFFKFVESSNLECFMKMVMETVLWNEHGKFKIFKFRSFGEMKLWKHKILKQ